MYKKKILVAGAGGFIGGYLVKKLLNLNADVIAVDIKPTDLWFQLHNESSNHSLDLKNYENCEKIMIDIDYIFNLACNMGGMGFIENNKAECMLSVLINTHLLSAAHKNNVSKYFFSSSACIYNTNLQEKNFIEGLRESDAYPAMPENGYGWEKLFSERMCRHFYEDFNLNVSIARFHNVYGPFGTYDGGREKSPAALCRKVAQAKIDNSNKIEIWGDGEQTRSFLYIDDCIEGILRLFDSSFSDPINIGSDEQVSINQMVDIIQNIADMKSIQKIYLKDKPKGVRGRSSNNELSEKVLKWTYKVSLEDGLKKTYDWIYKDLIKHKNSLSKYSKSHILNLDKVESNK